MEERYSVAVYASPLALPLSLFSHTYIVTEHLGVVNRYEVIMPGMFRDVPSYDGRIYKNILSSEAGFYIIFRWSHTKSSAKRWKVTKCSSCAGAEDSPAQKLYNFIENGGLHAYPHKNRYNMLFGPNSNSFTQWVIDQVPSCNLSLPHNAWGKNFKF
jgi:hypothetical protein